VLFLYRPRQTYMPYAVPVNRMGNQSAYRMHMQDEFGATRRVAAPAPSSAPNVAAQVKELAELHKNGHLTDEEFATAKAKVLGE
jgi:hypothetical protein